LACFALRRSALAVNSQFPQIVGLSRADFCISRIDESSRREPGERAQMIVLKDSRFIRTTEVTTLNHNLCVVTTFITSICCESKPASCRRPGDTLQYGLVVVFQYLVRALQVRTDHQN